MKERSLSETNPILAKEWNYERNDNLKPTDVTANSDKVVWWRCSKDGQEWEARISSRNKGETGCLKCFKNNK